MKRKMTFGLITGIVIVSMAVMTALAANDETLGNGAPQAKLLGSLNIIGVANPKSANMDSASGNVIFVPLQGKTAIYLTEGDDFAVLDKNGTDGRAEFQLPEPGIDPYIVGDPGSADTVTDYSVFVRPLGKPGGWATITTCADLIDSSFGGLLPGDLVRILNRQEGTAYCSIEQVGQEITLRTNGKDGKTSFTNVTAQLLTIVFEVEVQTGTDTEGNPIIETVQIRVPIFDDMLENEYWEYDNHNLKLLQVRFYDVGTDVTDADLLL